MKYYEIRRIAIDNSSWTALTPPIDCTQVRVTLGSDPNNLRIRTDAADSTTEKLIAAGFELTVAANPGAAIIPFQAGVTLFWMQALAGTGPAIVEFVR